MKLKLFTLATFLLTATVMFSQTKSAATLRLEGYKSSGNCNVDIPTDNPEWNLEFKVNNLTGDLAPNDYYTRRDPSSVLKVNGKYYVWYSYSLSNGAGKVSPWDLNDLYYATSTDGYHWTEQGVAIARGPEGSYDHRSAFTTEVFHHNNMFYLVYQASDTVTNLNSNNTIAMAYSSSADGPWTKLEDPILYPSSGQSVAFDKNAVHDPCIVYFNNKFYMYFKGEGNESPICSYDTQIWGTSYKQVKWGVAIADNVTGPYVKSEYNPITNTGHEVCVWHSGEGLGIMLHQDGPEYGTTQYSSDGLNFEIMGQVDFPLKQPWNSTYPEAAGLYRSESSNSSPVSGVSWGLSHVLNWRGTYGSWMYIRRFDLEGYTAGLKDIKKLYGVNIYPNPVSDIINIDDFDSGKVILYNANGIILKELNASQINNGIDVSAYASGIYYLMFKTEKGTYGTKVVKN
ncbi:T9SS type A sorting domain-containing protein [uncultured Algibacter sp.]|uniref:T9SS type A sorting domain-containing protein n=1 Tax=uncultured Algibacter sp. TaxID=298659 RepID=UPI00262FEF7C|nr:T9SS type A sorting domain-containing protein [uncultured Algibacter sp.]